MIVTEEKGLQDIFSAMENHSLNSELIENACAALWSLSMEGQSLWNAPVHPRVLMNIHC